MALKIFKNKGESGAIPLSAENLNYNFQEVLNLVCPVGKVEIFFDNDDHSDYLGFTWERTSVGKVPVGIDSADTDFNTIGKTGGEKTHTLSVEEMPSHKHSIRWNTRAWEESSGAYFVNVDAVEGVSKDSSNAKILYPLSQYADNAGGDKPHNNLQPYQVMAIWKRTA